MRFVVTGGAGFFGSVLIDYLIQSGHEVLSIDRLPIPEERPGSVHNQVDITDAKALDTALRAFGQADCIFHVAALLAHDKANLNRLWSANVDGTRNVMDCARALKIGRVIFLSSNCLFSTGSTEPVDESTPTHPIEIYGESKQAGETIVQSYPDIKSFVIRCPTIVQAGRLGLLTILFDFVREGRAIYLVGDGSNRYGFIAAQDLASACLLAAKSDVTGVYHISSDNVPTMYELYAGLQKYAGKPVKLRCIPEAPTVLALKILDRLKLSPLGPYHYRMLAHSFVFNNSKIKQALGWAPTRTNTEILCEAYSFYISHLEEIKNATDASAHKQRPDAGILNLLRMIS